jgi:transforming growth factor-beta-induced protein
VLVALGLAVASCGSDSNDGATVAAASGDATETTSAAAGLETTAAEPAEPAEGELPDIVGTALLAGSFTQLAALAIDAGLVQTLKSEGPFTVFAPTDDALGKLPLDVIHAVEDDQELLTTVLTYHVVPGKLMAADLVPGPLTTVAGVDLTVTKDGDTVYINGNAVAAADIEASNGVIHVMGDVLVPPIGDIIDVATTLPGFGTLAELVTSAGLVDTLKGEGPFTVFAPIDAAFEALPAATLSAVRADPELLTTVLTYHVIAGKLTTQDLAEGKVTTVAGVDLTITKQDGQTLVDGHPIAVANVLATNGIIHAMGDVLVPES